MKPEIHAPTFREACHAHRLARERGINTFARWNGAGQGYTLTGASLDPKEAAHLQRLIGGVK